MKKFRTFGIFPVATSGDRQLRFSHQRFSFPPSTSPRLERVAALAQPAAASYAHSGTSAEGRSGDGQESSQSNR
jgi:hypothetical protein